MAFSTIFCFTGSWYFFYFTCNFLSVSFLNFSCLLNYTKIYAWEFWNLKEKKKGDFKASLFFLWTYPRFLSSIRENLLSAQIRKRNLVSYNLFLMKHFLLWISKFAWTKWKASVYTPKKLYLLKSMRLTWVFFTAQHSISPEIGVHGVPVDNFSHSGSGDVNLCRFSAGLDLSEPANSNWGSKTSIKFEVNMIFRPLETTDSGW